MGKIHRQNPISSQVNPITVAHDSLKRGAIAEALNSLAAVKNHSDAAFRKVAQEFLNHPDWEQPGLRGLPQTLHLPLFTLARSVLPGSPVEHAVRFSVYEDLWETENVEKLETLLRILSSGREPANRFQFVNIAKVKLRLHHMGRVQDPMALIPLALSAFATFVLWVGRAQEEFERSLFCFCHSVLRDALQKMKLSDGEKASWQAALENEARLLCELHLLIKQTSQSLERDTTFVMISPLLLRSLGEASWMRPSFVRFLNNAPQDIQQAYRPERQEHVLLAFGIGDSKKIGELLRQSVSKALASPLPLTDVNLARLVLLAAEKKVHESLPALAKFSSDCLSQPAKRMACEHVIVSVLQASDDDKWSTRALQGALEAVLNISSDTTLVENCKLTLARIRKVSEMRTLLENEKAFWKFYEPRTGSRSTEVDWKYFFTIVADHIALHKAMAGEDIEGVAVRLNSTFELVRTLAKKRTFGLVGKQFLPIFLRRAIKQHKCSCPHCTLGILWGFTNWVCSHYSHTALKWPLLEFSASEQRVIEMGERSFHMSSVIGSKNALNFLGIRGTAEKKVVLGRVMELMRTRTQDIALLRAAQESLFNPSTRELHFFFAGMSS